ncbi:MAG: tRNA (N(6)-L-threonylcarbamoyladenosine(37)-C(2))-methylthiotransferase MtaB [Clostridia bacterium]|nr:tRNA (N(6)-L-threonylcarbamoyladenosine(37)-C(2))-methylthiotransferase MtaB [Clostridia bacterium]
MPFTAAVYTLGCKVNQYESEAICERLQLLQIQILPPEEKADVYIINTCTVTAEADRKARQFIRRAIAQNPEAYILVAGCYSQASPDAVSTIQGVDYICGTRNKMTIPDKVMELLRKGSKNEKPEINVSSLQASLEKMDIRTFGRTRCYIKIEDGCENHCAYCAIPLARGPVSSRPESEIEEEINRILRDGCREIVLTGIEVASYGKDTGSSLVDLLEQVDAIEGMVQFRLSSIDPSVMRADLVTRLAGLKHLAPHFHLSLQSGSSSVLVGMKRKYNADQASAAMNRIRAAIPDVQFTADIITGFPGETEELFEETMQFVRSNPLLHIHVFPYSGRKGTAAVSFPHQVPENIRRERASRLIALGEQIKSQLLETQLGRTVSVLVESWKSGICTGHTPNFFEVSFPSAVDLRGEQVKVVIHSHNDKICLGELCVQTRKEG